jgi:hypothetical protein
MDVWADGRATKGLDYGISFVTNIPIPIWHFQEYSELDDDKGSVQ